MSPLQPTQRRGTVLVLVLGTAMLVTVIGVTALMSARVTYRTTQQTTAFSDARIHAQSAIELGLHMVQTDSDWRTNNVSGQWLNDVPIGTGYFQLYGTDPEDNDLSDSADDLVKLVGVGEQDNSTYKLSVTMRPVGPKGMDCLASALHANYFVYPYQSLTASAPVSANEYVDSAAAAVIDADVEMVHNVAPAGTVNGTVTLNADAKETPDISILSAYTSRGTTISFSDLPYTFEGHPTSGWYRVLSGGVLSASSNPFGGGVNANSIYVIDCKGYDLRIEDIRIVGTLVILNSGPWSEITGAVHWVPTAANMPALLLDGMLEYRWSGNLVEADLGVNFNPPGTPFGGVEDKDTTDTYPSVMRGLVAIWGRLDIYSAGAVAGALVLAGESGRVYIPGDFAIKHNATMLVDPPPGFERATRPMVVKPGSWARTVD